ncbi:hypothetical protein UFOVP15_45 [uncultured Caudovirales phage]|uniref:Uncharacterized protein n=1 Tax=uncultured Caudovirales phage TaxID=2100421 RepID=A0A6J5KNA0_9CAUD|nr:hypothetical protein UFOVP15_45 [uncultured Caudovirales phage]
MTGWRKRTIQEMAQEAGLIGRPIYRDGLEAFDALVREDERERIAKWYASEGHMMFPVAIPDAIRSNT